MQEFAQQNPQIFIAGMVASFIVLWIAIGLLISLLCGWRALAERYRTEREFPGHKRWMQSGAMRGGIGFNHVLTLASDAEGIYLGPTLRIFPGQPRLFIPWRDIQVEEPRPWFLLMSQRLRLGPDAIPLRIRETLAQFLLQERGGTDATVSGTITSSF